MSESDLREWLGRVEKKVDSVLKEQAHLSAQWQIRPCTAHEDRLRALEQFRWKSLGVLTLLSASPGVGALVALLIAG